jgi:hypothetical protein
LRDEGMLPKAFPLLTFNIRNLKQRTGIMRTKMISLTALVCIIVSCHQAVKKQEFEKGVWKIRKVEILKDNQLKKVLDTGSQYWSFQKASLIEIFNTRKIQNILHIKMNPGCIRCYDDTGALQDELSIREIDNNAIALSSKKKVESGVYDIIYYLDKVKDTSLLLQEKETY